jgi:hypothetical protein
MTVAACSLIGYVVDGFTGNGWMGLGTALVCLCVAMTVISAKVKSLDK